MSTNGRIRLALIGAGNRGNVYADFIHRCHPEAEIAVAAEVNPVKRAAFGAAYGLPERCLYADADQMLNDMQDIDAVIVANMEHEHCGYTIRALQKGCHVLLEKPMSNDPAECLRILRAAEASGRVLMVCHVLRYTPFFSAMKRIVESGRIGRVMSIQHAENVSYTHIAHSYVRGNFRRSDLESPMILAKSCHDIDILLWLAGAPCENVTSFGSLGYFLPENAPKDAPMRCTDGCMHQDCPYDARKYYLGDETRWPVSMLCQDLSLEGRKKALQTSLYGRCVFHCDNNVVDHQVVNLAFANGITATFSMNGFNQIDTRATKVAGTLGEITGELYQNKLSVRMFGSDTEEIIHLPVTEGIHGGGDSVMVSRFLEAVANPARASVLTTASVSTQGHLVTFAAEQARLTGAVIHMPDYIAGLEAMEDCK